MKNIEQNEWETALANDTNAVVLDVRTPDECADGRLENAVCLDFFDKRNFLEKIDGMDKSKNYYVYCRSGNRSGMACELLKSKGFKNVYNLKGGLMKWTGRLV